MVFKIGVLTVLGICISIVILKDTTIYLLLKQLTMNFRFCNAVAISLFCGCTLFYFSSCIKAVDYFKDHSAAACCRIDSLDVTNFSNSVYLQRFHFSYNSSGQPTLIAAQVPAAYNYQDYIFRYDNHGRLKDYIFTDGGGGTYPYIWDRYTYPNARTIVDTTYDYQGSTTDPNPIYPDEFTNVSTITLDNQGRISRVTDWSPYSQDTTYIHYDAQGDVVVAGLSYDDKVNWYQLSPTWQLVFRNYSAHNPYVSDATFIGSYDSYGLPTLFETGPLIHANGNLMVFSYNSMQVFYSCDKGTTVSAHGGL
jgi:hypothetical protein